jgi:hypothetical protein
VVILTWDHSAEALLVAALPSRSGKWDLRNASLLNKTAIDVGYRLVVAELEPASSTPART